MPLPDADLAFLDLPLVFRGDPTGRSGPEVTLRAQFAGREHEWQGRIVRTEGEIDPFSRMVHVVAQVRDPYAPGTTASGLQRAPLAAGLYVEAEILGDHVKDAVVIPRSALWDESQVLIVDADDRLRFRTIEVLRRGGDEVVVSGGLAEGERLCLSTLSAVTDGMHVRTSDETEASGR